MLFLVIQTVFRFTLQNNIILMKRNEKIVSIGVKIVPILQKSRISVQFLHCITIATAPIILQSSSVPKSVMLHIKVGGTPIWVG